LKFNDIIDQTLKKRFALKLLELYSSDKDKVKEVIIALQITSFYNLFNIGIGRTQSFNNTKENQRIFEILKKIELIGKFDVNKKGDKIIVNKKHYV
jgi:hypothetical protein